MNYGQRFVTLYRRQESRPSPRKRKAKWLSEEALQIAVKRRESESEVTQSCPTLCDPMDCSLPGSSVHGIFQARILEWVAIPSPGDLPDPGIEPASPSLLADSLLSELSGKPTILKLLTVV